MSHFHLCCCFVLLPLFTLLSSTTAFENKNYANFHQKLATFYVDHSELLQKTLDHFVPDLLAIKESEHLPHCYNRSIISSKTELASGKKIVESVDIFSDRLETIAKSFFAHNIHYFDEQEQSGQKHLLKRRLDVLLVNLVKLAGYVKQCVQNRENGKNGEKVEKEENKKPTTVVGLTSMIFYSEEEFRTSILNHHLAETLSTPTNQSTNSSSSSNETENTSSDDDENEYEYELNRRRAKSAACHPTLLPNESIPLAWSWKNQANNSILSPVYDQGRCSSCYVFATTEALEAQYRLHYPKNTSQYFRLSVQATLNCVEHGCQGGTLEKPLAYFKRWGLPLMSAAPYQGQVAPGGGSCKKYRKIEVKPKITCFDTCDKRVETMQLTVWKRGPVAVSFNAQSAEEGGEKNMCDKFRFFRGSLWEEDCSDGPPNHALLLVGWTSRREWILKNSWGENWGDEGYFRLPMDNRPRCGITRMMGLSLLDRKAAHHLK